MGIRRSVSNLANSSSAIIYDVSTVSNLRKDIYKRKCEIIQTPMVRQLVHTVFQDNYLPRYLCINRNSLIGRIFDRESKTYHPNGVVLYEPEVTFDYEFACALLLIFQDLYPDVYEMSKATLSELSETLNNGTWNVSLTMKDQYLYHERTPAFYIDDAASVPLCQLPVQTEDLSYANKTSKLPVVSLILGIISVVLNFGFDFITGVAGFITGVAGIITGIIGLKTTPKKTHKKAVWGVILSIFGVIVIPLIQIVLSVLWIDSFLSSL